MKTFATELREKRLEAGLKQVELARLADISYTSISKYEHGWAMPSGKTLVALEKALGKFDSMRTPMEVVEQMNSAVQNVSEQETETTTVEQVTEQDTVDTGITLVEFINDFNRMCDSFTTCENCPFRTVRALNKTCFESVKLNPTKAVEVVNLWVLDNPVMTKLEYALQHFPNLLFVGDMPVPCVKLLFGDGDYECNSNKCTECWSKPIK